MKKHLLQKDDCIAIQLSILDEVDAFCKQNGLRYSLAYGSLIGAVRHKGYIPWDDDIDLLMPRPDYDRFISSFQSEKDKVLNMENTDACIETFSKVVRKGTLMTDRDLGRSLWGVNIDIFPIDGVLSSTFEKQYDSLESLRQNLARICPFYKVVKKNQLFWILKYFAKRILSLDFHSFLKKKQEATKLMRSVPFETAEMAGAFWGDAGKDEFMDKDIFCEYIELPFEGRLIPCLARFDDYLRALYGNYMELPPLERRVSQHNYDCYSIDTP